jgi:hypothetical protein
VDVTFSIFGFPPKANKKEKAEKIINPISTDLIFLFFETLSIKTST